MQPKQKLLLFSLFLFLFFFFVLRGAIAPDPDFGWHIQFGKLLTTTKAIPVTDPFSYTMPSYHFVDHEWANDILLANFYELFGMWPLIIGFSLVGLSTLYLMSKGAKQRFLAAPLFLAGGTLFEFMGVRPQIISWFFLALLTQLLWQKKHWHHWRWFLPLLFLIWANLHGGFAIGIVVLLIFRVGYMIDQRKSNLQDTMILVLSFGATLVNPYGYHLWTEVIKSVTDPSLRWSIQEWYPAYYFTNIAFWIYTTLSLILLVRYWRKFSRTTFVLYFLLLVSGLSSMRNIPIFVIVSFYPTLQAIDYLQEEASKHIYGKERFLTAITFFSYLCLFLFLPQLGAFLYGTYVLHEGQNSYPTRAIAYLRTYSSQGNLFSSYDWGGYLIWQLPEKKVFIDGRMPSWRNPSAPSNESTYAFGEYKSILTKEESFAKASNKYHIDTILVATGDLHEQPFKIFGIDIKRSAFLKRFFRADMSFAPVVSQAKQMHWQEVYHDKTATIFQKVRD